MSRLTGKEQVRHWLSGAVKFISRTADKKRKSCVDTAGTKDFL